MTQMTTEEAFVKVLQMHGIEHGFGIIGSAFMPISDLFPQAGIKFWDVAHEGNGGMICDGYTRATGKIAMAICSEWPWYHQFYHADQDSLLEPHSNVASDPPGCKQDHWPGRFPGSRANGLCLKTWSVIRKKYAIHRVWPKCLIELSPRLYVAQHRLRSMSPRDYWTPGYRYRNASDRRIRKTSRGCPSNQ